MIYPRCHLIAWRVAFPQVPGTAVDVSKDKAVYARWSIAGSEGGETGKPVFPDPIRKWTAHL